MAKVRIVLASRSMAPSVPPIQPAEINASAQIASSASSQDSTLTASYPADTFWSITSTGGAISVSFGRASATAVATAGWMITDGQTREFLISPNALKCAVIDA